MDTISNGKVLINGVKYDSPLDSEYPKRNYREWKEGARTSFRAIWLDHYIYDTPSSVSYEAVELKLSNRGKAFLDERELKGDDAKTAQFIFENLKISP